LHQTLIRNVRLLVRDSLDFWCFGFLEVRRRLKRFASIPRLAHKIRHEILVEVRMTTSGDIRLLHKLDEF